MSTTADERPKTLAEAVARYAQDEGAARAHVIARRWPDGVRCPACVSTRIGEVRTRGQFRCRDCRLAFSPRLGTVMQDSALPYRAWLVAEWAAEDGTVSASSLARALGVTRGTARYMLRRIGASGEPA